jgi:hypothetical protein
VGLLKRWSSVESYRHTLQSVDRLSVLLISKSAGIVRNVSHGFSED